MLCLELSNTLMVHTVVAMKMCCHSPTTDKGQESVGAILAPAPPLVSGFFLPISEQVAQFGGGKRKQLLQIKEKLESIYDFHLKSSHPNCLVTWTDKHGWAVTVIQILNDHLFRPVNKHCSVASLHHLSWSRGVFQLPSYRIHCFFIAVHQSQQLLCSLLLRSSAGKCYLDEK